MPSLQRRRDAEVRVPCVGGRCTNIRTFFVLTCVVIISVTLAYIYSTTIGIQTSAKSDRSTIRSLGKRKTVLQRGRQVWNRCQQIHGVEPNNIKQRKFVKNVFVNDEFRLLYCSIAKVACSNMGRLWMVLDNFTTKSSASIISNNEVRRYWRNNKRLKDFTETEIQYRLDNYRKLIIVREPFERLISAFNDKFMSGTEPYFYKGMAAEIIRQLQGTVSKEQNEQLKKLTFAQFLDFLILQSSENKEPDAHWDTYTNLCHPCYVKYNFVGKLETLDRDIVEILGEIGYPDNVTFPKRSSQAQYKTVKSADLIERFKKGIPKATLQRVKDIYANDTFLFDYQFSGV